MSSPKNKKLEPVITEFVLEQKLEKFEDRMDKKLQQYFQEFSLEITKGIQVMFDEQNRRNDLKFATKVELQGVKDDVETVKHKVDRNYDLIVSMVGDLKAIRENQAAADYRQSQHTDQLANHETRLLALEGS